jgi:POT family proton-dependent oligopeptide transporter
MGIKNFSEKFNFSTKVSDVETTSISSNNDTKFHELEEYNEKYPEPTEEDYATLKKITSGAPYVTYLICLIEFAERASYYGVKGRLNNFIQLPLPTGGNGAGAPPRGTQQNAGALGLGLQTASAITLLLTFCAYLTPLWGGYISDKSWGRIKTIWYGIWVGAVSHIILIIAALPSVIKGGSALAPTIISILTLSLGTGLIKPNLLPLLYDQFPHKRDAIDVQKDGTRVIISRAGSLEKMTLVFYWAVNAGAFLSLATAYSAKYVGFWLAYLIPGVVYFIMVPVLIVLSPILKKEVPNGISIIEEALKVFVRSFSKGWYRRWKSGEFWEWAKPENILARGEVTSLEETNKKGKKRITWTSEFVNDVKVTVEACAIFLFFVIYNINDGGLGGIQNSQAASMTTNGVPNDLIDNFNPLTIIIFIPFLNYVFYPILKRFNIELRPVQRIFIGFILASLSQVAGAIIQWKVYESSPCGYYATDCEVGTGVSPISVWVETVLYVLQASSECFANTGAYEIAYTRSPEHMKGLVMSLFLFMQSLSAALSQACTPALNDPYLIWPFVAFAVAGFILAFWFLWLYRDLHIVMEAERIVKEEKVKQEYLQHLSDKQDKDLGLDNKDLGVIERVVSQQIDDEDELKNIQAAESAVDFRKQ